MKVTCVNPKHIDANPSMHLYEERAHCFSCGYSCSLEEAIGDSGAKFNKREPTDLPGMLRYIKSLPLRQHRGLVLPTDDTGYYVVWPDDSFYKKRLFNGKSRYMGPTGLRPTLFAYPRTNTKTLWVVEGEINCITLARVDSERTFDLCSPGSASEMATHLPWYLTYNTIYVIVDKDRPGVIAGLKLKAELLKHKKVVHLVATEKDASQVYQDGGAAAVIDWYQTMGMQSRVSRDRSSLQASKETDKT